MARYRNKKEPIKADYIKSVDNLFEEIEEAFLELKD